MSKGAETRASILGHAIPMAAVVGLEGLTIGRLAARTGLSKSGLFGHFGSKEALQLAVLQTVIEDFTHAVVEPALKESSGESSLRGLFAHWMEWAGADERPGGCPLMGASIELDDRPGQLRDCLADHQTLWLDCIRRVAQRAVSEGSFRTGLDTRQFAFEFQGIGLGFNFARRLLHDPDAMRRARIAFDGLVEKARS